MLKIEIKGSEHNKSQEDDNYYPSNSKYYNATTSGLPSALWDYDSIRESHTDNDPIMAQITIPKMNSIIEQS